VVRPVADSRPFPTAPVTVVRDDQTYAEIPDSELDLLPVLPTFDAPARIAYYQTAAKRHKARLGNLLLVQNVLTRLHQNREVATELGHQMTAKECDVMVDNWLKNSAPMKAEQLFHAAEKWGGSPWWLVCLTNGRKERINGDRGTVYVPRLQQATPPPKPPTAEERAATLAAMDATMARLGLSSGANGKPVRVIVPAA